MRSRPGWILTTADGRICGKYVIDAIPDRVHDDRMESRTVVIVAYPGVQSLDVAGPFEVFAGAGRAAAHHDVCASYDIIVVSDGGGPVVAESGLTLVAGDLSTVRGPVDTLVIPGGGGVNGAAEDGRLVDWIATTAVRARRAATVCSGSFLAARAGLLDGHRVTTHWARAAELASCFPDVEVDPDPIYIRDGSLWSSAGVTAGIDLALALVEDDLGTDVSQLVARWMVMFLHRPGGQTQFATPVWTPRARRSAVREAQSRVEADPGGDHRVATMAGASAMSERHFARVFAAEVGETPSRYVERVRTEAARIELESTRDTLEVIAARCGFGTSETLRRTFQRRLHSTPDAYRRRFAVTQPGGNTP
jgi:transcriptional regulator GlxA family with amidase domain